VLDEVDILFGDEDFEKALQCLISSSPVDTQYLFVTATLPKNVYSKLVEVFPDCEMVMGPSMHRISSRLEEVRFQLRLLFHSILFFLGKKITLLNIRNHIL
jgi:ATP-dependent RNA helicase DDX18/HAS1